MSRSRAKPATTATLGEMVGREELTDRIIAVLAQFHGGRPQYSLVTLVGTPGIGKTRVAREVISRIQAGGRTSAFAYLGEETSDTVEAVARRVQDAFGVPDHSSDKPVDVLINYLLEEETPPLLVLDNCETHVSAVGDLVTDLLGEVPTLQVLATSRTELGLHIENLVPLKPLSIPVDDPEVAEESESMILLNKLLQGYGIELEPVHRDAARQLAMWAGGLPLVLTIIAARIKGGMPPSTLLERLPWLLTSRGRKRIEPHHITLIRVLDDSYQLCTEPERLLLERLSVFAGGGAVEVVEQVCSGDGIDSADVGDLLVGLADQALLIADPTSGRYEMLPPIREYGLARLRERGEEHRLRAAHATYFCGLARTAAEQWIDPASELSETEWLEQARREMDNFRSALAWCLASGEVGCGREITVSLARLRVWWYLGLLSEAVSWFKQFMGAGPPTPTPEMIGAGGMLGWMQLCQGNQKDAAATLQQCRSIQAELELPVTPPQLDFLEGAYLLLVDNDPASLKLLHTAWSKVDALLADGAPVLGDRHQINLILGLGAGLLGGDPEFVESSARRTIGEAEDAGADWALTWGLWVRGLVPLFNGRPRDALTQFHACLRQQIFLGDRWGPVWTNLAVYWSLARLGEHRWAAQVHGGSARLQEAVGSRVSGLAPFAAASAHAQHLVVAAIGQSEHDKWIESGRHLRPEQIHANALREPESDSQSPASTDSLVELTAQETKVSLLIMQGETNRQIAETLFVSDRTVETHLRRIYSKLGLRNRAALASWATENLQSEPDGPPS